MKPKERIKDRWCYASNTFGENIYESLKEIYRFFRRVAKRPLLVIALPILIVGWIASFVGIFFTLLGNSLVGENWFDYIFLNEREWAEKYDDWD